MTNFAGMRKTGISFVVFSIISGLSTFIGCNQVESGNSAPLLIENSFLVAENAPIGEIIGTIHAVDLDNDEIMYSIVHGNDEDRFQIDVVLGQLTVKNSLNLDQTSQYSLTVRASDGEKFSEKLYDIVVLDEMDDKVINTSLLTSAPWLYESVTLDGIEDESWSNFELDFDGNLNGGNYTSKESPNLQIWSSDDFWSYEERGNNIIRAIDNRLIIIEEISEMRLVMSFTIGSQNARSDEIEGDWKFTLIHE